MMLYYIISYYIILYCIKLSIIKIIYIYNIHILFVDLHECSYGNCVESWLPRHIPCWVSLQGPFGGHRGIPVCLGQNGWNILVCLLEHIEICKRRFF